MMGVSGTLLSVDGFWICVYSFQIWTLCEGRNSKKNVSRHPNETSLTARSRRVSGTAAGACSVKAEAVSVLFDLLLSWLLHVLLFCVFKVFVVFFEESCSSRYSSSSSWCCSKTHTDGLNSVLGSCTDLHVTQVTENQTAKQLSNIIIYCIKDKINGFPECIPNVLMYEGRHVCTEGIFYSDVVFCRSNRHRWQHTWPFTSEVSKAA